MRMFLLNGFLIAAPYVTAEAAIPLRNQRPVVEAVCDEIAALSEREQRVAYEELSGSMRSDVWSVHLERFLEERDDLTDAERAVIHEALGFVATGALEMDRSDPGWEWKVARVLAAMEMRARTVARLDVLREALASLDNPHTTHRDSTPASDGQRTSRLRTQPLEGRPLFGPCTCSVDHDWCATPTSPERCNGVSCEHSSWGCGALFFFPCDGICF